MMAELNKGSVSMDDICSYLPKDFDYGMLDVKCFETLVERVKEEMERKEILSEHKPPIKQLPNGKWYTRINGKKIERKNKRDVENEVIKVTKGEVETLRNIYPAFLERRKRDVADTTWIKDVSYFEKFIKDSPIADIPIVNLTIDDGYKFLDHCLNVKKDMKKRYWNNVKGSLEQMIRYSLDRGIIIRDPFEHLRPKKDLFAEKKLTRDGDTVFSDRERISVCRLAEEDAEATQKSEPYGILILFNLGLRNGELCPLKWGDIETGIRGEYIHIQREAVPDVNENGAVHGFKVLSHCKTPAGDRRLQLNKKVKEVFEKIKEFNQLNGIPVGLDDFIFMRKYKGEYVMCTPRSFDPRLRKYCRKAGMTVIKSPHDIRRTVLTNLYMAGMPLKKI